MVALQNLECTSRKRKPSPSFISMALKTRPISCTDEYKGTTQFLLKMKFGEKELELAQNEGDAGDIWGNKKFDRQDRQGLSHCSSHFDGLGRYCDRYTATMLRAKELIQLEYYREHLKKSLTLSPSV